MTAHAAPFYCPYCGDEDIRPFGEWHGDWRCGACRRVWGLRYVGIARPDAPSSDAAGMPAAVAGLEPA
jgi:predicted RNA-binding Zn-ribbon protein involved in translation (DUF1610 family)